MLYNAYRCILGIKTKVSKDKLLTLALGQDFGDHLRIEQQNVMAKMANHIVAVGDHKRMQNLKDFCRVMSFDLPPQLPTGQYKYQNQDLPIKHLLNKGLRHQINWYLGSAFNGYGKERIKVRCPCPDGAVICQTHIQKCSHWDPIIQAAASLLRTDRPSLFHEIENLDAKSVDTYIRYARSLNEAIGKEIKRLAAAAA